MALRVWRIGFTLAVCDGCGREERRLERPSGYHVLLRAGWAERGGEDPADPLAHVELLCPDCVARRTPA
jgi:hypothetical protein